MKLKNKIILLTLGIVSFAVYLTLLILKVPNEVPFLYDINEKIAVVITKWILISPAILPLIFAGFASIFSKKPKLKFGFIIAFVFVLFENVIFLTYFILAKSLEIGVVCEIPLSIALFIPLAFILMLLSIKLKNAPYLSRPAIRFKCTKETEFIWTQTHIFARDVYFLMSFVLFIVSIIFSFFRLYLIELGIFVFAILLCTLIVYLYSKSLYKKYIEMKTRKENLEKSKTEKKEN